MGFGILDSRGWGPAPPARNLTPVPSPIALPPSGRGGPGTTVRACRRHPVGAAPCGRPAPKTGPPPLSHPPVPNPPPPPGRPHRAAPTNVVPDRTTPPTSTTATAASPSPGRWEGDGRGDRGEVSGGRGRVLEA